MPPVSSLRKVRRARLALMAAMVYAACCCTSCVSDAQVFTQGRLLNPCDTAIPTCNVAAACVLGNDQFYQGSFPGGMRILVKSKTAHAHLVIRFLLSNMNFPGSEMQVQAFTPNCGSFSQEHPKNVDLFHLAGKNHIIEFHLNLPGKGDHLVQIFSDMAADFTLTTTVSE